MRLLNASACHGYAQNYWYIFIPTYRFTATIGDRKVVTEVKRKEQAQVPACISKGTASDDWHCLTIRPIHWCF